MANKKGKFKSHHIDLFGVKVCMPKGMKKEINKASPKLRGKKLNARHIKKYLEVVDATKKSK